MELMRLGRGNRGSVSDIKYDFTAIEKKSQQKRLQEKSYKIVQSIEVIGGTNVQ